MLASKQKNDDWSFLLRDFNVKKSSLSNIATVVLVKTNTPPWVFFHVF